LTGFPVVSRALAGVNGEVLLPICSMIHAIRLLGIDPGLRRTGWGMIEATGNRLSFIASGTVTSDNKKSLAERLVQLHDGLSEVVRQHEPSEAAVEHTFVNKDAGATLKLGQARGIALLVPSLAGLPVAEYAPNLVKKTVVGTGHAEKEQIRAMVKVLMPRATFNSDDAADALAIAICHAQHRSSSTARLAAMGAI
jgi:crossover junction endodeoxyribonuclease RuvC